MVEAVACALAIQRGMSERNAEIPPDQRIEFRIGINLGDVIVEEGDIHGDGVNIAARLEALAEPGGICVSRVVRDQVRDKLDLGIRRPRRAAALKNIARPVRASSRATRRGPPGAPLPDAPANADTGAPRQALDRGSAVPEHERRSGAGIFRRRHGRGHRHRAVAHQMAVRHRAQFDLCLQRQGDRRASRSAANSGVRYVLEGSVRKGGQSDPASPRS